MPSIQEMRRELKPVYGRYTDAVISMIGLRPHEAVLAAAKRGDLLEAHSVQVALCQQRDFTKWKGQPDFFSKLMNWQEREQKPGWFSKPLKAPGLKRNGIQIRLKINRNNPSDIIHTTLGKIGEVDIRTGKIGRVRALLVPHLQQSTKELPSKEARKIEGWKNAVMIALEQEAKERDCDLIAFSAGTGHSRENISQKPIQGEILETYGRLPMQHGYKLAQIETEPDPMLDYFQKLKWIKRVSMK
ncbi:MAG: hypothetical protein V1722_04630 [Candidatus Micrarchaeota archaeon]